MSNYILKSEDNIRSIVKINIKNSFAINPKNNSGTISRVKNITLYDTDKINVLVKNKYYEKYKRIVLIIKNVYESDDSTDADFMICLDEVTRLKDILINKYRKFLNKASFEYFLKDLLFIEKSLKNKIARMVERKGYNL